MQNQQAALSEDAQQQLRQQILKLVQSSNFHSGPSGDDQFFTFAGAQQDYRDSVSSGDYLLVTFPSPQKIKTVGGDITAVEIVWGLNRPSSKNSLFTIDESGRLVSHAKYAGEVCLQIDKTLAQVHP